MNMFLLLFNKITGIALALNFKVAGNYIFFENVSALFRDN